MPVVAVIRVWPGCEGADAAVRRLKLKGVWREVPKEIAKWILRRPFTLPEAGFVKCVFVPLIVVVAMLYERHCCAGCWLLIAIRPRVQSGVIEFAFKPLFVVVGERLRLLSRKGIARVLHLHGDVIAAVVRQRRT